MTLLVVCYAYFAVMILGGILYVIRQENPPTHRRTPRAPTQE